MSLPLWLRYVDDTFTVVHKDFHEHLNGLLSKLYVGILSVEVVLKIVDFVFVHGTNHV